MELDIKTTLDLLDFLKAKQFIGYFESEEKIKKAVISFYRR